MKENFLITYDLRGANDYQYIHDAIKELGPWWHYMESTWIIKSDKDSVYLYNELQSKLKGNEYILIIQITRGSRYGILPTDAWEWIDNDSL